MRVINKRNLYPIFFLSGILILVLFFSGFSFLEGLTTTTPVVNDTTTPVVNDTTTPVVNSVDTPVVNSVDTPVAIPNTNAGTVPIQVSPATAAIVSGALDSIIPMGVSVIKNTHAAVANAEATNTNMATTTTTTTTNNTTNWTPISSTSAMM